MKHVENNDEICDKHKERMGITMIEKSQLDSLSDENLKQIEKWIKEIRAENKRNALKNIADNLLQAGFSKGELLDYLGKSLEETGPKYKNPDNEEETWSGKGRKPNWFKAKIAEGMTLEQLTI